MVEGGWNELQISVYMKLSDPTPQQDSGQLASAAEKPSSRHWSCPKEPDRTSYEIQRGRNRQHVALILQHESVW